MLVMNWEQMKNSPATRGLMTVAEGARDFGGFLLKITFKPAFMSYAQNAKGEFANTVMLQYARLVVTFGPILLSGVKPSEWNDQLSPGNVAFTLGVAFLAAGVVDMAGLGLQAIGENRK